MKLSRLQWVAYLTLASTLFQGAPLAAANPATLEGPDLQAHEAEMLDWRKARHERLTSESGYLAQVGLEWLQQGENRIGKLQTNDIRIDGGPDFWGTVTVEGNQLTFRKNPAADVHVEGTDAPVAVLVSDDQGEPTIVRSGGLSFYVIFRESFALRIKDTKSPDLLSFKGVDSYDTQYDWKINGRFIRAEPGQTIEIGNILGQLSHSPVFGTFEFEREGERFSLIALGEEDSQSLWFLFADKTSGRETYGSGRFLYSDGMPMEGRLLVDFNKAYNPPCAFNAYSTCPIPPQQNRLRMAVTAGEKKYHAD